jgi:twitching motility protein PilT
MSSNLIAASINIQELLLENDSFFLYRSNNRDHLMKRRFAELITSCALKGYSDVHIRGGQPMVYRKDGNIRFDMQGAPWSYFDVDELIGVILNAKSKETLRQRLSVDLATTVGNLRVRINIFNTDRGPSLAIRLLPNVIPTIENLNVHPSLSTISELKSGLVLICGATGCGKTTTIASILNDINQKRAAHVITLEDPIEYQISSRMAFVEQREVGTHVSSFERGLIDIMREDPDVIMVGELRDPQTIALTLNVAESGHLVVATLHATNVEDAIYRIINSAPPEAEEYIRYQVASTISWVILQKLVYNEKAGFRLPLLSIMRGTSQIRGLIRDKKLFQIENAMHASKADGMYTQERYLDEFLGTRDKFFNPSMNFSPAKDAVTDVGYSSPVFDSGYDPSAKTTTLQDQPFTSSPKSTSPKAATKIVIGADESQYVINETDDLQELIAEAERGFKR